MLLRPLDDRDDPLIMALNEQVDVIEYLGSVARIADNRPAYIRAIEVDGAAAGVVGIVRRVTGGGFELVCAVLTRFQRNHIGRDACRQVLNAEREKNTLDRVLASIAPTDSGARALAEGLGFLRVTSELWEFRIK